MMVGVFSTLAIASAVAFIPIKADTDGQPHYRVNVHSRPGRLEMIPARYLSKDLAKTTQWINLPDSGVLESLMYFGSPQQAIMMLIDSAEDNTMIPGEFVEQYQSATLQITSDGVWQDMIKVGDLTVEQSFYFSGAEAKLGLSVAAGNDESFVNNVIARRMLGMSIVSFYLTRQTKDRLSGEMMVGQLSKHPKNALIRYNPTTMGEEALGGSWRLKINGIRVDGETVPGSGIAVIDTTTPFAILPVKVFTGIIEQLQVPIKESQGIMFSRPQACLMLAELPPIYIAIATDEFVWDASRYIIPADEHGQCILAMVGFDLPQSQGEPLWVLGTNFLLDRVVVFDQAMMHVGLTDYEPDSDLDKAMHEQNHVLEDEHIRDL